jgi:ABC-type nickel/cobalt efflux system permease component RcnA
MANLLFYIVAIGAVLSAVGVVFAKNPIMSVLSLLTTFFCLATIYLLAGFQFMAAAQLLVYAGAIMVLFLFVIMLLNLGHSENLKGLEHRLVALVAQIEQHDNEEEQHHDRAGVHEDLDGGHELEPGEQVDHGQAEEAPQERENAHHGALCQHDA